MTGGFSIVVYESQVLTQCFFEKGAYDSFFTGSAEIEILLEGVILNKKKLLNKSGKINFSDYIRQEYANTDWRVIQKLEGEFRGYIWDKKENKVLVFTNPTSTQRIFYSKINDRLFIDSNLVRLSRTIKNNGFSLEPDITSLYQLLSIGNLLENRTPIQNTYKIPDSHFLDIDCNAGTTKEIEYFNISELEYYGKSKESAIDEIHEVFTDAVKMEYEKDIELTSSHLSFLSGGLDSRIALLYAIKNDFNIGCILCFSQSGYFDEKISRKIASDYHLNYEFIPLDQGAFLRRIDELTTISEGTSLYTGGIHVSHALDKLSYTNFSLFHGGQIGDGILGGFNSIPQKKAPSEYKIIANKIFLPKIKSDLDKVFSKYEKEEIFLLKNLAYNRTVLGAQVLQQKGYLISPFMTKDFVRLAVSLPEEWKYNHRFYLQWIARHCKEAQNYTWERTLMKPDALWKTKLGEKIIKRGFNLVYDKLLGMPQKTSMYPYHYYYDSDPGIQKYYRKYFEENIERADAYPELQQDVIQLFSSDIFYHKCQAINILSIFKLYF